MKLVIAATTACFIAAAIAFLVRNRSSGQALSKPPGGHSKNESWVVHRGGEVLEKKARSGVESLNSWERLLYCLWVTDYMMRNAGDFANAEVMYPEFQEDAKRFAKELSLPQTYEAFSLSRRRLQREYFERFEAICDEMKSAEPGASSNGDPATRLGNSGVTEGSPSVN